MIVLALLAAGLAAFSFYNVIGAHRSGRAKLNGNFGPILDSDREDDPVGYSTAIMVHLAFGVGTLALAILFVFASLR